MRYPGLLRHGVLALLATAGLMLMLLLPGLAESPPADAVDIKADSLSVEGSGHTAVFSGNVVARRGEWVLTCTSLTATYNDEGQLTDAEAKGPVVLVGPEVRVEAGSARLEEGLERVIVSGDPTLRRGEDVLHADQMTVHLGSERVDMKGVKGRFVVPPSAGADD